MVDMQSALQVTSDDPTGGKESGVASSKSQAFSKVAVVVVNGWHLKLSFKVMEKYRSIYIS